MEYSVTKLKVFIDYKIKKVFNGTFCYKVKRIY